MAYPCGLAMHAEGIEICRGICGQAAGPGDDHRRRGRDRGARNGNRGKNHGAKARNSWP